MPIGCYNDSADNVPRADKMWSDNDFNKNFVNKKAFPRLKCRCGSVSFEVLMTGDYEVSAKCICGLYYVVQG